MDYVVNTSSYDISPAWSAYLNNLAAYNANAGVDRAIDVLRMIWDSQEYYPVIVPFPAPGYAVVGGRQQQSGVVQVPSGSILVAMTGEAIIDNNFFVRIYDKATGNEIYNGQFGFGPVVAPTMLPMASSLVTDAGTPIGPFLFPDPYIILDPASLQCTVLNGSNTAQFVQVALCFAVPFSSENNPDKVIKGMV